MIESRSGTDLKTDSGTVKQLVDIAMRTFGAGMTEQEVLEHLFQDVISVVRLNGQPAGFGTLAFNGDHAYLSGAVVDESCQQRGIYGRLARQRLLLGLIRGYSHFKTRTQNPNVERGIARALRELYRDGLVSFHTVDREFVPKVYGRMLTKTVPISKDPRLNGIYNQLDRHAGDAYLLTISLESRLGGKDGGQL